jgi:hypothetical protein
MTAFYPGGVPTRILSWQQTVLEADPGYQRLSLQPWVYEFSNGRLFIDPLPLYGTFDIVNELLLTTGQPLTLNEDGPLILAESP